MRTEIKVIATVALAVLALEGLMRLWAPVHNRDREHIHAFPEIVSDLHEAPSPRIVFFGNSLMLHGLDIDQALPILNEKSGQECHIEKIVPVGTAVRDWIYLYDTYFTRVDQHPDIIVVGFVAYHLRDVEEVKVRRLTRHFCSPENLEICLDTELDNFEQRVLGRASYYSAIFGDQSTIQNQILSSRIRNYGAGTRMVNRIHKRNATAKTPSTSTPETFHHLQQFITELKNAGVRAYFVPMPQPKVWELNPELVRIVESNGMEIIDAREIDGMTESDFSDGYHLGVTGKAKLSQFLGEELGSKVRNFQE